MRSKRWPYFKDWGTIFGKDRATGEEMETIGDAMNDLFPKHKGKASATQAAGSPVAATSSARHSPTAPLASDADSELRSRRGETVTSPVKSPMTLKKRTRMYDGAEKDMVNLMGKFLDEISEHMGEIKVNLGTEREGMQLRSQLHAAIKPLPGLTPKEKLQVTGKLCDKQKDVEFFLSLGDEDKYLLARMILDREY